MTDKRDAFLVNNIHHCSSNWLPLEYQHLIHFDIYETLHMDEITIAEMGCTIYENVTVEQFLAENEENDNKLQILKIEQFRLILQFEVEKISTIDSNANEEFPKCIAVYHKNTNQQWQQITKNDELFKDEELHILCMSNTQTLHEFYEQTDLNLMFQTLTKQQMIHSIINFMNTLKLNMQKTNKMKEYLDCLNLFQLSNERKHKQVSIADQLKIRDRSQIELLAAQLIALNTDVLDEFEKYICKDLHHIQQQFEQLMDKTSDANDMNDVLQSVENIVCKVKSLSETGKLFVSLELLRFVIQHLVQFIIDCCDVDGNGRNEMEDFAENSKLNVCFGELESQLERVCNKIRISMIKNECELQSKQALELLMDIQISMKEWKLKMTPILGPLFSDNIRCLTKQLRKYEKKNEYSSANDVQSPVKKMRLR